MGVGSVQVAKLLIGSEFGIGWVGRGTALNLGLQLLGSELALDWLALWVFRTLQFIIPSTVINSRLELIMRILVSRYTTAKYSFILTVNLTNTTSEFMLLRQWFIFFNWRQFRS